MIRPEPALAAKPARGRFGRSALLIATHDQLVKVAATEVRDCGWGVYGMTWSTLQAPNALSAIQQLDIEGTIVYTTDEMLRNNEIMLRILRDYMGINLPSAIIVEYLSNKIDVKYLEYAKNLGIIVDHFVNNALESLSESAHNKNKDPIYFHRCLS